MQTTKKKPSLIFILVGAVLAGYLGYLINGAWSEGVAFNEFMNRFNEVCAATLCKLLQYEYYKSGSHCIRNLCDGYCYVLHQPEKLYARQGVWYSEI